MDDEIPEGVVTVVGAFQTPTEDPLKNALQIASTWPRMLGCLKSCALDAVPSGRFAYAVRHLGRNLTQYGFFIQSNRNVLTSAAIRANCEIRIGDANFSSASIAVYEIATGFFEALHDAVPSAFSADDEGELFSIDESDFVLPKNWPACRNAVNSYFDDKFLNCSDEQNLLAAIEKEHAILFPEFGKLPLLSDQNVTPETASRLELLDKPTAAIVLQGVGKPVIVNGIEKKPLTKVRYGIVSKLLDAFPNRLTKGELEGKTGKADAVKTLRALRDSDDDWKSSLLFPEVYGAGYGVAPAR